MNLRDRLNAHFKKPAPSDPGTREKIDRLLRRVSGEDAECPSIADPVPLERALPGEIVATSAGPAFRVVQTLPLETCWGSVRLGDILGVDLPALAELGKDKRLGRVPAQGFRFVDTETTGLAGGTGTYAFLVGVGEIRGEELVVTQYVLRDFDEEGAVLRLVGEHLGPATALVTFNGKCFDLPLLETRRIMNRVDGAWLELPHFDLLHPSRRIWKMRLARCPLTRLETEVLGYERENDIDGALIPQVYFDYLRSSDARELARVVEHNRLDIVSMVALLAHAVTLYGRPKDHAARLPAPDLFSLGRLHHGQGNRDLGRDCMESAVQSGLEEGQEVAALHLMARAHRQAGEHARAAEVWERIVALAPDDPQAYLELAKHHEHRTGDLQAALEWVRRAQRTRASESIDGAAELEHREARIRRKLDGGHHRDTAGTEK